MGMFDDLVPTQPQMPSAAQPRRTGMFDDLVPQQSLEPFSVAAQSMAISGNNPQQDRTPYAEDDGGNIYNKAGQIIGNKFRADYGQQTEANPVIDRGIFAPIAERQDGSFELALPSVLSEPADAVDRMRQRGPNATVESNIADATTAALGALAAPVARMLRSPQTVARTTRAVTRADEAAKDLQAFERQGVRPFGPAFGEGPIASTAKQLTEVPFAGKPVRTALEDSIEGARDATMRVADQFGRTETADSAGTVVRSGMERFKDARPSDIVETQTRGMTPEQRSEVIKQPARNTSLKTKQAALYERAWENIPANMREGRAVEGEARVMGNPKATRALLQQLTGRNSQMLNQARLSREGASAAYPVQGGLLGRAIRDLIESPTQTMSLQTLRNFRSEVRRLASGMPDTEKNTLKLSDVERIQGAITQDMVSVLERNALEAEKRGNVKEAQDYRRAIYQFRQADRFTAMSAQRLETIEKLFNAPDATALYRGIKTAALSKDRGDIEKIRSLRRVLTQDEVDELSSAVIRELGEPVASARGATQEIGFSVQSFITNWTKLSPEARNLLFKPEHRAALDDIVRINNRLANVEALANTSRSASNAIQLGALTGVGTGYVTGTLPYVLGAAGAGYAASLLFASPKYARWAAGYAALKARGAPKPKIAEQVNSLRLLAANDNTLQPIYQAVVQENGLQPEEGQDVNRPMRTQ